MAAAPVRLFVDAPLSAGASLDLDGAQTHYLRRVMRRGAGDAAVLFNGRDGEWRTRFRAHGSGPNPCRLEVETRLRPQPPASGPLLAFAPVRRARVEMLVEKATELGVRALQPVATRRVAAGLARPERLRAHAVEAAEQCGRLDVPDIRTPLPLAELLARPGAVVWGDPRGAAPARLLPRMSPGATLLVGPEGGFDCDERRALAARDNAFAVSLGPLTLRAETAALALLALWRALAGDDAPACYAEPAPGNGAACGTTRRGPR